MVVVYPIHIYTFVEWVWSCCTIHSTLDTAGLVFLLDDFCFLSFIVLSETGRLGYPKTNNCAAASHHPLDPALEVSTYTSGTRVIHGSHSFSPSHVSSNMPLGAVNNHPFAVGRMQGKEVPHIWNLGSDSDRWNVGNCFSGCLGGQGLLTGVMFNFTIFTARINIM